MNSFLSIKFLYLTHPLWGQDLLRTGVHEDVIVQKLVQSNLSAEKGDAETGIYSCDRLEIKIASQFISSPLQV